MTVATKPTPEAVQLANIHAKLRRHSRKIVKPDNPATFQRFGYLLKTNDEAGSLIDNSHDLYALTEKAARR